MKKSDFSKCHGWKIALAVIMIIINLLGFIYIFAQDDYSVIYPYSAEVSFNAVIIANFLMFIPSVILIIYVILHRKDEYKGEYTSVDSVGSVVIVICVSIAYIVIWFIIMSVARFGVPLLFPKVA